MKKLFVHQIILLNAYIIRLTNTFLNQKISMLLGVIFFSLSSAEATTYYSKSAGAPEVLSSWGVGADGSGSAPIDFTTNGDVFIISAASTMTTNNSWTIGDGTNVVTLQVDGKLILGQGDALTISSYSLIFFNSSNQLGIGNGNKTFNLNAHATFKTINQNGIAGTLCSLPADAGNFKIKSDLGANYEFNGTAAQATLGLPAVVNNLTISNISGVVTLASALTATTVTIKPGAKLTHTAGALSVTTLFDIQSNATDRGTFVVNGTGTVNAPSATVQQYLTSARNWYISSPVTNATTTALSTAGSVVSYSEPTAAWVTETGTTLAPMKGYIAVSPTSSGVITFSGALNTGAKSISLTRTAGKTKEGFNLVGNPYPAYVDWDAAAKTNLETTVWYRTKCTSGAYVFDTYGATPQVGTGLNGIGNVTKNIPPMQAFWVRVVAGQASGTLAFENSMQAHQDAPTNRFRAPSVIQSVQKILRLKVTNGTNSDEAIILFNPNAQDGLDDFDSPKMTNANPVVPEIYTLAGNEHVVINGFSNVNYDTEIPLGFTTGESNTFSIKATEINNFDDGTIVILKDNQKVTEQELSLANSYSFTSDAFSSTSRFSLVFRTNSITTETSKGATDQHVSINKNKNNQITINCMSDLSNQSSVSVYNAMGKLLLSKQLMSRVSVLDVPQHAGICLVKVVNAGKSITKKMIFN